MKTFSAILCGGATILLLTGCVGYGHQRDRYGDGYDNRGGGYTSGYYDGYYGPYSGGYWANDGYFYYLDQNHNYRRDDARHFRRQRFDGGNPVQTEDRTHDRNGRQRDQGDHGDGNQ